MRITNQRVRQALLKAIVALEGHTVERWAQLEKSASRMDPEHAKAYLTLYLLYKKEDDMAASLLRSSFGFSDTEKPEAGFFLSQDKPE